ncbi:hypothetical protein GFL39_32590 [Rhizobium leguminosarum bv. viciae]|nr:hypothetical protein [Rhizobium leguminosarum bv. viciae]NKL09553.1 hypothetical protein [Rhizobium leguminosarum bv. viciae]NKL88504.1 hypothetical protein [Rhizobium leguminosarum bv. viciae]NKL95437.1 hypothetical protein [Rhizobium leguminosarum bv. viciae]
MLVTGIQPRRVGAVNDSHMTKPSPALKDLSAPDSCDEHRNDGGEVLDGRSGDQYVNSSQRRGNCRKCREMSRIFCRQY